jgi:hypothetical protein
MGHDRAKTVIVIPEPVLVGEQPRPGMPGQYFSSE